MAKLFFLALCKLRSYQLFVHHLLIEKVCYYYYVQIHTQHRRGFFSVQLNVNKTYKINQRDITRVLNVTGAGYADCNGLYTLSNNTRWVSIFQSMVSNPPSSCQKKRKKEKWFLILRSLVSIWDSKRVVYERIAGGWGREKRWAEHFWVFSFFRLFDVGQRYEVVAQHFTLWCWHLICIQISPPPRQTRPSRFKRFNIGQYFIFLQMIHKSTMHPE